MRQPRQLTALLRAAPSRTSITAVVQMALSGARPRLEPLRGAAQLRIMHCVVSHEMASPRVVQRGQNNPVRRAPPRPCTDHDLADFARPHDAFDRVSVEASWIEVDTTDGYQQGLDDIVRFVNGPA